MWYLSLINVLPTGFLFWYTFRNMQRKINHRVNLFAWILYILYLPLDSLLGFILSDGVYLVLSTIMKVFIVFTITDTEATLLEFIQINFQPQILLIMLRSKAINLGYLAYLFVTEWYISLLDKSEERMFRESVVQFLVPNSPELSQKLRSSHTHHPPLQEKETVKSNIPFHKMAEDPLSFGEAKAMQPEKRPLESQQLSKKSQSKSIRALQQSAQLLNLLDNSMDIKPIISNLRSQSRSRQKFQKIKVHYEADPNRITVMLQMGSKNYPRFQKYFLELNHKKLLIISSHDRLFEEHELLGIKDLGNDFYEMVFPETGLITSRIAKFPQGLGVLRRFLKAN